MAEKKKVAKAPMSDSQIDRDSMTVGEKLAAQEKVTIMIAMDDKDPNWHGKINGYSYSFPKGQLIEVPKDLATMSAQTARVSEQRRKLEKAMQSSI